MPFIDNYSRYDKANQVGGQAGIGQQLAFATYDFAVLGGAIGTLTLLPGADIPNGAIIFGGGVEVLTIPTSGGGATIAVQVEAANDIINAAAITGAPWSTTGRKNIIPLSFATSVKLTANRNISVVIATATLTAGKFNLYLYYAETL